MHATAPVFSLAPRAELGTFVRPIAQPELASFITTQRAKWRAAMQAFGVAP